MTIPSVPFQSLGHQAQNMARHCGNDRTAMILNYVALGSFIVMTGFTAAKVLREVFPDPDKGHGRGRH